MKYYLSLAQLPGQDERDSGRFDFYTGFDKAPRNLSEWVHAVGTWTPDDGGDVLEALIVQDEFPGAVRLVPSNGHGFSSHTFGAFEQLSRGDVITCFVGPTRSKQLKFRVSRFDDNPIHY